MSSHPLLLLVLMMSCRGVQAKDLPTFRLDMVDGQLIPAQIVVPARTRFKIEIRNLGKSAAEFESLQLRKEKVLAPGAQSFVVIHALSPGTYKFFDDFHLATAQGLIKAQ